MLKCLANGGHLFALPLVAAALASGCPEAPPTPPASSPSLEAEFPSKVVTVNSTMEITFASDDANGPAEGEVVATVERADGNDGSAFVGATAEQAAEDGLATVNVKPVDGEGSVFFACGDKPGSFTVTLTATDTLETVSETVACAEPGNLVFTIDPDDDGNCDNLQADSLSSCVVTLNIAKSRSTPGSAREPADNEEVAIEVIAVADVKIAAGVRGVDPDGIPAVLLDDATGDLKETLALTTDAAGKVAFAVRSPEFGVAQTVTIRYALGDVEDTLTLTFDDFRNQAALTLTAAKTELESGATTQLRVTAKRTDGSPAALEEVVLSSASLTPVAFIDSPDVDVAGDGTATVTLDDDGEATVEVTAPTVVGRGVTVPIEAAYDTGLAPNLVPVLATSIELSVSELGSVIGNADFSAATLKSDLQPPASVTLDVTAEQGSGPFNDVVVTVSVSPDSQALIQFTGGTGAESPVTRTVNGLTAGAASFEVVAANDLARGTATVAVQMLQNGEVIFDATRTLIVERDPILQSVVFVSATPSVLGVRGGTQASTSSVVFRLFDDTGAPLAGVPVNFVTNATADRGVSVEQSDISAADGSVQTTLAAGTIAGPVTVVVTARPVNGRPITVESASIAIVGGLPTFLNSSFLCENRSGTVIETTCTVNLVDRFTNRVGPDTQVQFRSEGGSITPAVPTDSEGDATGNFITGNPGHPGAEVTSWSYGVPVTGAADLAGFSGQNACTDGTTRTACNLLALCSSPATERFCPLPGRQTSPDLLPVTKQGVAVVVDQSLRCDTLLGADPRACGYAEGCLDGSGIDCPLNLGCFDFSPATFCPQNGLLTITASARGEESFLDGNGNGILDFVDLNGDGRNQTGEPIGVACRFQLSDGSAGDPNCVLDERIRPAGPCPADGEPGFNADLDATCVDGVRQVDDFIDSSEPFLDKNDSCSRDNFLGATANGMTQVERQVASDLFSDVDGSLTFGFDAERDNTVEQTNGSWDRDTELFLETHVLQVGGAKLLFGERCTPGELHDCRESTSPTLLGQACVELPDGSGIATGCNPSKKSQVDLDSGDYVYAWIDGNGNCPTTGFAATASVTATGNVSASAEERTLDESFCGFAEGLDADRPWCSVNPFLGARALDVTITTECNSDVVDNDTLVTFALGDEVLSSKKEFSIRVNCSAPPP